MKINKGFSLIEIIIYISLLSLLIIGVFSSVLSSVYNQMKRPTFNEGDYKLLLKNQRGFIAMTLVITASSLLLAFSFTQSIEIAHFFDQTRTKEYRIMNYYNAYSCIDQAILNISHDYFYEVSTPIKLPDFDCVIETVKVEGEFRSIEVYGDYKNVKVKRKAKVRVYDDRLDVVMIE